MKVLNKVLMCSATLVLLTACAQKISAEKFQAKIDALEEHQYQEATVKHVSDMVGTGMAENVTEKENYSVKFTWSDAGWSTEDTEHALDVQYLVCIKGLKVSDMEEKPEGIPDAIDYKVTFYSDFSVVTSINGSYSGQEDVMGTTANVEYKYNKCSEKAKFDKYGYMVLMEEKMDMSAKMSAGGITMEGTQKGSVKITVSYK